MTKIKRFLSLLLSVSLAFTPPVAYSAFDPVNDDTDIFLANPNITASRPNILVVLDNTASWQQNFAVGKGALEQVFFGLPTTVNVGLMIMSDANIKRTGPGTGDGGYVRFAVRQMTEENRTALGNVVRNFDISGDKGDNNLTGMALYEAYLYYGGKASRAGDDQSKADHDGTTLEPVSGLPLTVNNRPNRALRGPDESGFPTVNSLYTSPIEDGCQKNHIIYVSFRESQENAAQRAELEGYLAGLTGQTPPSAIGVNPNNFQSNWADELARYMANADVNTNVAGTQTVSTYTIEVNPATQTTPQVAWTAFMNSVATNGNGRYKGVTLNDTVGAQQLIDAINAVIAEVQAENSVFASTTLPVSVNVRGTNLNQVYIGVFRPDAKKSPRWLGNLKMYQLALDPVAVPTRVFLADARGVDTEDPASGFILPSAESFWTQNSTYWSFLDPAEGGPSDLPDGNKVEKGGAAQQARLQFPNAEGSNPKRRLYTCTTGNVDGSPQTCSAGSNLLDTPFTTGNDAISAGTLGLGSRLVSALTAFDTKTVTALTDRRAVALTNAASPIPVLTLDNGVATATRTITNLTALVERAVSSLTGLGPAESVTDISRQGGSTSTTYNVTTANLPANLANGDTVTIKGTTNFNGSFTVSSVNSAQRKFQITHTAGLAAETNVGTVARHTLTGTVTASGHGFTSGQTVTISGATPTIFNAAFGITLLPADPNNAFTINLSAPQGDASGSSIKASRDTTTATATYSGASLVGVSPVTISGANPAQFNSGGGTPPTASPTPIGSQTYDAVSGTGTFTYTLGAAAGVNVGSPVYAVSGGSTTVDATTSAPHLLTVGTTQPVNISGSTGGYYDGTQQATITGPTTFTFMTTTVLPANTSTNVTVSTGTSATVTAAVANHGFCDGIVCVPQSNIVIEGGTEPLHTTAGAGVAFFTVDTVSGDGNSFTYSNTAANDQQKAPAGSYTVRLLSPLALATIPNHGYGLPGTTKVLTIAGASHAAYNGEKTVTVRDTETVTYSLGGAVPGVNMNPAVTASEKTMTARATSAGHGFSTGDSVTITGAVDPATGLPLAAFNVTNAPITVPLVGGAPDPDRFTYSIAPATEGAATGAIRASGGSGPTSAERDLIIRWVRGEDNRNPDENKDGSTTDIRASVHGDVLHSRPAVLNYNRTANSENDVFIFYGANDGIFHAVRGGRAADPASPLQTGQEAWGFIPPEFFNGFKRMRDASPAISSSFKKPYFMDGPIGVYTTDAPVLPGFPAGNGRLGVGGDDAGDVVNLYIAMRRGGRFIYALDVKDPLNPKLLWKIDTTTPGFSELGQTWSQPTVVAEGFSGYPKPVLIFGAGYDPTVEDIPPTIRTDSTVTTNITAVNTSTGAITVTGGAVFERSMGRGMYVVDAITGALVWSAGGPNSNGTFTVNVPGMIYAIPSDVSVIKNETGAAINRAYVGDTGGNMWRIDFKSSNPTDTSVQNLNGTLVTKIAAIAEHSSLPGGLRKFLHAPDVVGLTGFDAVLAGTGDREHPFDTGVEDRFYMFKDKGSDLAPLTGTGLPLDADGNPTNPIIIESAMFDATSNCIQDCSDPDAGLAAQTELGNSSGWFIRLAVGEKVVSTAVSLAGTTFFNTNQPRAAVQATPGTCVSDLGLARQYQVSTADATAVRDLNATGGLTGADRFPEPTFGGYLPSPVHVVVMLGGKPVEVVISGVQVTTPPGATLQARLRKYWYKEVDQ